jgi:hypothetical protein
MSVQKVNKEQVDSFTQEDGEGGERDLKSKTDLDYEATDRDSKSKSDLDYEASGRDSDMDGMIDWASDDSRRLALHCGVVLWLCGFVRCGCFPVVLCVPVVLWLFSCCFA